MKKKIQYIIMIMSIIIFVNSLIFSDINLMIYSLIMLLLNNIIYGISKFNERIVFLGFNVTFFTFLISRFIIKLFTKYEDIYNTNKYGLDFENPKIIGHIVLCLWVSLLFIYIGYMISEKNNILVVNFKLSKIKYDTNLLKKISKVFFYITYIFAVLLLIEKILFTQNFTYSELYVDFDSRLPLIFVKLGEISNIVFFIFLSTNPSKQESKTPILLYLFSGVLSLVVGQRNNFVLNFMVIIVYFCFRNKEKKKWLNKKQIIAIIIALPIILSALNLISYSRNNQDIDNKVFNNTISEFFYSQGASVNLIGYAEILKNDMPKNGSYTFGRLKKYINDNMITQVIIDTPVYKPQSIESAIYGNSFADSVSYILSPGRYINGWGYGSSYIAELYIDFGYIGIMLGNLCLGSLLFFVKNLYNKGVFVSAISLFMIRLILYMPRDTTMSFLVTSLNIVNILGIILVCLIYLIMVKKIVIKRG